MPQFTDIYMRDYPGDVGEVPSDVRQGVCQSPDIIPFGPTPNLHYLTDYAGNYDGPFDYFANISANQPNYIYVRAKNAFPGPGPQTGSVKLYWSKASLLLWPTSWSHNLIPNANGTSSATLASSPKGAVVVGQGAFLWQPPNLQNNDHFCLIAQVVTQQDPNIFPTTIEDFAQWVANNANIAWRNVTVVKTPGPAYSAFVSLQNPVAEPNQFTLTVTCTNVPDGATVNLLGSEPTLPINFAMTVGPANQTGSNPKLNQLGWTLFNVPGRFDELIQLSANYLNGFPHDSLITYGLYWLVQKDHALAHLGVSPEAFNLHLTDPEAAADGVMLPLGDYSFQF